uniref:Uncharacterized protein n=1 Tax=Anguilla anguilla TaxID=7936 RepID=A0A0E9SNR2_ANGAN
MTKKIYFCIPACEVKCLFPAENKKQTKKKKKQVELSFADLDL